MTPVDGDPDGGDRDDSTDPVEALVETIRSVLESLSEIEEEEDGRRHGGGRIDRGSTTVDYQFDVSVGLDDVLDEADDDGRPAAEPKRTIELDADAAEPSYVVRVYESDDTVRVVADLPGIDEGDVDAFHTREYFESVFDRGVYHLGDVTAPPFAQHVAERPPHSGIAISITHEGEEFGVLTIHFPPDDPPQRENVQLLEELADDIGLFLHNQVLESDLRTFKEIAERIDDPIMLQDLDGTYRVVNEAVTDYADMSKADLVGKSESAFMDDETAALIDEKRSRVVETESAVDYELSPDLPTMGRRTFSTTRYPHYDENGDLDGTVAICRDVTERAHRETQMHVVDRVLRHNINNEMTVIRGLAENIAEAGPQSVASHAEDIVEESDRLLTTVDKERRITNLLWGNRQRHEVELDELLDREITTVRNTYPEAEIGFAGSPSGSVLAHPHVGEAIGELLDNAVRHNDREVPRVTVRGATTDDGIRIEIVDDGPGIPTMERRILTDGTEIDQLYHGSGLGLWFVYWIVNQSGGTISFRENEGRGSVIIVDLPAVSSETNDIETATGYGEEA